MKSKDECRSSPMRLIPFGCAMHQPAPWTFSLFSVFSVFSVFSGF